MRECVERVVCGMDGLGLLCLVVWVFGGWPFTAVLHSGPEVPRGGMPRAFLLHLCIPLILAVKPTSLKWAQYRDGTLVATFPLKRGQTDLCDNEVAVVEDGTLKFAMSCAGEPYELNVELQHPVDEQRVTLRRQRSYAIVTLAKVSVSIWWSNFAKHPQKFKKLIERDPSQGDDEPDEEEAAALAAVAAQEAQQVGVDSDGKAVSKEELLLNEAIEAGRQDLGDPKQKVRPQTVSKLKAVLVDPKDLKGAKATKAAKLQQADAHALLGTLLIKRGDIADAIPLLVRTLKLQPKRKGMHQTLANALQNVPPLSLGWVPHGTTEEAATYTAALDEVTELYRTGSRLMPDEAETYYQLGRMINMKADGKRGVRDEAVSAWKTAVKIKPDMVEVGSLPVCDSDDRLSPDSTG